MAADDIPVVREYLDCWNDGDLDGLADVMAADVHAVGLPGGVETDSLAEYRAFVADVLEAFPDINWSVEDIISEGDRVAAVVRATGTHDGEFMGIPSTGNEIEIAGNLYFELSDGKIQQKWSRTDDLGMLQQLGVLPEDLPAIAPTADD